MSNLSVTLKTWQERIRQELWQQVIPFWLNYSLDRQCGGYFNCLDRNGQRYDDKKYVWLQGRQVWMLARLCRLYPEHPERQRWLEAALLGLNFLRRFAYRPQDQRVYFCLSREGQPIYLQRKIFSECFYVMALAECSRLFGDPSLIQEAEQMFAAIWSWVGHSPSSPLPLGRPRWPGSPAVSELAIPMILLNVIGELAGSYPEQEQWCLARIRLHHRPELRLVLETVALDGSLLNSPEGRLLNPGHAIEAGWFLLEYGERTGALEGSLQTMALEMIAWSLQVGWDPEEGGLFYFLDREGYSPVQLEWSLKLWWPHCEALVATLAAFVTTGSLEWWRRFEQVADYTFAHFPDPEYGEWFGYLDRQGRVSQRFKGGPYKGCFHVPRALMLADRWLSRALDQQDQQGVDP
ncbi:MAG: AGE family epimerase/isomerase [Thermostichus sp. HHBFW_bins_43]